jgi:hypothetical protein
MRTTLTAQSLFATMCYALPNPRRGVPRRNLRCWVRYSRKRKGIARVRLEDGSVHLAELHWYEASGIGKREFKIKRFIERF